MDIMDDAHEREELFRRAALSHRHDDGPSYTGYCHNCGDQVDEPLRWCDADCLEDWEKQQRARADERLRQRISDEGV